MSGIYLLIVFGMWVGLTWALWKGWQRWLVKTGGNRRLKNAMALVIGVAWFGTSFWYAGGQKLYYDMQVRRLCAIDGGIRVYETVKLPAERFDKHGNVQIPDKARAKTGDEYYYESETKYLRSGDPQLLRMRTQIIRRNDGKVLGEIIRYARGGGDIPGPWHLSSFTCPNPTEKPYLEPSVFQ